MKESLTGLKQDLNGKLFFFLAAFYLIFILVLSVS